MTSAAQANKSAITLKGSAEIVCDYLSMFGKFFILIKNVIEHFVFQIMVLIRFCIKGVYTHQKHLRPMTIMD